MIKIALKKSGDTVLIAAVSNKVYNVWNIDFRYGFNLSAKEIEYLLDLPEGTLAVCNIIDFKSMKLKGIKK